MVSPLLGGSVDSRAGASLRLRWLTYTNEGMEMRKKEKKWARESGEGKMQMLRESRLWKEGPIAPLLHY